MGRPERQPLAGQGVKPGCFATEIQSDFLHAVSFHRRRASDKRVTMQGKQPVIDALNAGLTIELTAINQYFCQSKMCKNWGLNRLAAKHYHESLGEMKHAEFLIDRIIFLEGVPEIARYDVIRVGTNIPEQLKNDLELEMKGVRTYNDAIALCLRENDGGSRELLEKILVESEEHVDWLESQLDLIKTMGLENYLVTQVGEDAEPSH
jgi:bacterioferritin